MSWASTAVGAITFVAKKIGEGIKDQQQERLESQYLQKEEEERITNELAEKEATKEREKTAKWDRTLSESRNRYKSDEEKGTDWKNSVASLPAYGAALTDPKMAKQMQVLSGVQPYEEVGLPFQGTKV